MSNSIHDDAYQAYSKIQSLLKDGLFDTSDAVDQLANEFDYRGDSVSGDSPALNPYKSPADIVRRTVNSSDVFPDLLHSSEDLFQELLQDNMQRTSDCVIGVNAGDNVHQAEIAGRYSAAVHQRYTELDRKSESRKNSDAQLVREVAQEKAERDLWSLLEILSLSNLLDDIDDEQCESTLQGVLALLPVTASIPDFVNAAYAHDQRIRRGAVLKEWLERAAADKVEVAPAPHAYPGSETLGRILKESSGSNKRKGEAASSSSVQSMAPDAQVAQDGLLQALDGVDRIDQENLLRSVFFLLRSGQVLRAQQLAAEHRVFWLAASLQGIASHYHKSIEINPAGEADENSAAEGSNILGVARCGNPKQPIWTRTCWKHASRLAGHPGNWNSQAHKGSSSSSYDDALFGGSPVGKDGSLVGTLECSIYAALSNNTKVLLESPLLSCWHDRVWVLLKAAHERDLSRVVHRYRCLKSAHSALYPGCDAAVISAERDLLEWSRAEVGHLSTGNCANVFNRVPPPAAKSAEALVLQLQAAVMEGRSGISHFLDCTMVPFLRGKHSEGSVFGLPMVLRVFAHFCIWLKFSAVGGPLVDLVSDEVLYLAVEKYIDHLIASRRHTLIAAYAAYLNRPRRIAKYCELLRSIRTSAEEAGQVHEPSGQSAEAAEVLQLASVFFPLDVMDITRSVVEGSQFVAVSRAPASSAAPPTPSSASRNHVHFSESDVSSPPPHVPLVPATVGTPMEEFNSIRDRQATPAHHGILRLHPEDAESPGVVMSHRPLSTGKATSGDQDAAQMEALRWLFFDPTHRLEAVKQTNRLITTFLVDSARAGDQLKLAHVRLLLTEYLPHNSVTVGYALLKQRRANIEDVIADHALRQTQEPADADDIRGELRDSVQLDELCWESNVCKLELWKSLVGAMEDFDAFQNVLVAYSSEASRMVGSPLVLRSSLGKYRSKIEQAAAVAVAALLRTIECSPYSTEYDNPALGYKDIWMRSDSAIMSSTLSLVSQVGRVVGAAHAFGVPAGEDNSAAVALVSQEVEECVYLAGDCAARDGAYGEVEAEVRQLSAIVGTLSSLDSDALLKVSTAVTQIKLNFLDHKESLFIRSVLVNKLLSTYLKVCVDCGNVMETLEHSREATLWYYKAITLANVIASEDHSLQLETLLNRHDLEALVSTINKASIKVLRLDPDFNVVNA